MSFIVLDTDVASDLFAGQQSAAVSQPLVGNTPCLTLATVGELLAWPDVGRWNLRRRHASAGPVEVGDHVGGPSAQGVAEGGQLGQRFRDTAAQCTDDLGEFGADVAGG